MTNRYAVVGVKGDSYTMNLLYAYGFYPELIIILRACHGEQPSSNGIASLLFDYWMRSGYGEKLIAFSSLCMVVELWLDLLI